MARGTTQNIGIGGISVVRTVVTPSMRLEGTNANASQRKHSPNEGSMVSLLDLLGRWFEFWSLGVYETDCASLVSR